MSIFTKAKSLVVKIYNAVSVKIFPKKKAVNIIPTITISGGSSESTVPIRQKSSSTGSVIADKIRATIDEQNAKINEQNARLDKMKKQFDELKAELKLIREENLKLRNYIYNEATQRSDENKVRTENCKKVAENNQLQKKVEFLMQKVQKQDEQIEEISNEHVQLKMEIRDLKQNKQIIIRPTNVGESQTTSNIHNSSPNNNDSNNKPSFFNKFF